MQQTEKLYIVRDQWLEGKMFMATSFRQAVVKFASRFYNVENPKLFKVFNDCDDKVVHTGYGFGKHWCSGGELIPYRVEL